MAQVSGPFKSWYDNRSFYQYLKDLSAKLAQQRVMSVLVPRFKFASSARQLPAGGVNFFSTKEIFDSPAPCMGSEPSLSLNLPLEELTKTSEDMEIGARLINLRQDLGAQAKSKCEREYVKQLENSFSAFQACHSSPWTASVSSHVKALLHSYLKSCHENVLYLREMLKSSAQGESKQSHQSFAAYVSTFWLRHLNRESWDCLTEEWKRVIIMYGLAITELQRAQRLVSLLESPLELTSEFYNRGHQNWKAADFPESLLVEVESGIMICEVQEEIASQIRSPPSNQNAVMQLNMGEGKSTVIVPIIAAYLADGS